jgi:HEAT repeat protein
MKTNFECKYLELFKKEVKTKDEVADMRQFAILFEQELNDEVKSLCDELRNAGLKINNLWDLVNTKTPYPEAISILLRHLQYDYHDKNKEAIIRALAIKEAIGKVGARLITTYNTIPKEKMTLRWAIGNTIYATITKEEIKDILPIVQNKENGISRQMFVAALGKAKPPEMEDVLIKLLEDDEVMLQAVGALGRMRSQKAKEKINTLLSHSNNVIRKEAQKVFKKISNNNNGQ